MAIRNLITRGYGAGATIAFVVTRGYSIGVTADVTVPDSHFVLFRSVSRSASFSSTSFQGATFRSVSNTTINIVDTPQPLGFLLTEDGGILLQENDLPIALE